MSNAAPEGEGLSPKPNTTPPVETPAVETPTTETSTDAAPWFARTPKRVRTLLLLLAGAAVAAVLYAAQQRERADALDAQVVLAKAQAADAGEAISEYDRLQRADQLLFGGDYRAAREAYQQLAADTTRAGHVSDEGFDARLNHIGLLGSYQRELDTLRQLAGRPPREVFVSLPARALPQPVAPLALEETRPGQYDSLNFALRKAEMRVRSLEGRLRQNSGGNYLTFKSGKGSDVYYVGDVRDGKANGSGVALLSTGSRYQGEWRDNRRHGRGTFYWPDGAYYEGNYVDDERDGNGTYHFPDGSMFVGDWEADLRNGEGIYYDKDGEVVARGTWDDDELVARK